MSKKKKTEKPLQKRLSAIVKIYRKLKGKENKRQLKSFIDEKVSEIIAYKNTVGKQRQQTDNGAVPDVLPDTQNLQPSVNLLEELQHTQHTNGQVLQEV